MVLGLDCKALFEAQLINVSMFVEFGSLTNLGSDTKKAKLGESY